MRCDPVTRVRAEPTLPKLVVVDLSAASIVDMQSAYALAGMADELTAEGIQFHAVEPRSPVATGFAANMSTASWAA